MEKKYTYDEAYAECLKYYEHDELAAGVTTNKYLLRDNNDNFLEKSPIEMYDRITNEVSRIENMYPNSIAKAEIRKSFADMIIIPQGSPMFGIGNNYQASSLSNCYTISSPLDNYTSIIMKDMELANVFKRRGGIGLCLSNIRPRGMHVNNSARTSDGITCFMERYSNTTKEVSQSGRRGACLLTLSCLHPDIEEFINIKKDLTRITGANISVKWTDEFMTAVKNDVEVVLRFPVDATVENARMTRTVKARDIWKQFVKANHQSAEPGFLNWSKITGQSLSDCYKGYETVCCNPCSELPLSAYSQCLLTVINLTKFVKNPFMKDAEFNKKDFNKYVRMGLRIIDDIVDIEIEKLTAIIEKIKKDNEPADIKQLELDMWNKFIFNCRNVRRVGLGITGLADMLAFLNLKYDSKESLEFTEELFKTFHETVMDEDVELAKERGKFNIWNWEDEKECHYIKILPEKLQKKIKEHGRRHISVTTCSPAGSISILAKSSSGIEPIFKRSYIRKRKLTPEEITKGSKVDSTDSDGNKWISFEVNHHGLEQWKKLYPERDIKESPYWNCEAGELDWKFRIKLQGIIGKYITHAISSTCNLPKTITEDEVSELYMMAWKEGLKGVTIYREGSRQGVMTDRNDTSNVDIKDSSCPKRPPILPCEIHYSNIQGNAWILFVGLLNGRPFEIMGGKKKNIEIPKKYKIGWTKKNGKNAEGNSTYDLYLGSIEESDDRMLIKDIISEFTPDAGSYTRIISGMLSHGVPIKFIREQLRKDSEKAHMASFEAVIARILKKYIKDGEQASDECPKCKIKLVYKDGCKSCLNCGFSLCN